MLLHPPGWTRSQRRFFFDPDRFSRYFDFPERWPERTLKPPNMIFTLSLLKAPADAEVLGVSAPVLHTVLVVVALAVFPFIISRRLVPVRAAAPDVRFDRLGKRIQRLVVLGFGQSRQRRYKVAGTLHILIFAGFVILSLRTLTLVGEGFDAGFTLPGLGGDAGDVYATLKDYTALVVLVACGTAALRRLVFHPARYSDRHAVRSHGPEAYVILGAISLLMVSDAFYEGSEIARANDAGFDLPLSSTVSLILDGMASSSLGTIHVWAFWVHNVTLLSFLCFLPVSKHFHVITALPNVFLMNMRTGGSIKPPRHDIENLDDVEKLGVSAVEDFTWKHVLDFYSCTDCGRCTDNCPAYATGTPLSPRLVSIKSRDFIYDSFPITGKIVPADRRPAFIGDVIKEGELWACTTCGACEDACPVTIEYIDKIVDMRRHLVDEGLVPRSLQKPLADLGKSGNPYGKPKRRRGQWCKDEGGMEIVRTLDEGDEADLLFFTDSCASFDPRIQQIARAMGGLISAAGEDCGTLGRDEVDSGHEARRIGEEGLFEALRDQNLEAMGERKFSRIITTDPHAMNALRNDGYGLDKPVLHHSELLAELIENGKLKFESDADGRTYTFHDPCYLGRHNKVFDAPRKVLDAIPGIKRVEMERSRNRSFCCGGGSLYLFNEGEAESHMGENRLDMAEQVGADVVVTACPFCMINFEDAVKTTGREGKMEIIDLAELVLRFVRSEDGVEAASQGSGAD